MSCRLHFIIHSGKGILLKNGTVQTRPKMAHFRLNQMWHSSNYTKNGTLQTLPNMAQFQLDQKWHT